MIIWSSFINTSKVRRTGSMVVLVLSTLAFCIGCQNSAVDASTTIDDVGRSVAVPTTTESIVTLAPSLTEILIAAGGLDRLVAVSTSDDLPEVDSLQKISALPVDFESIIAINPDLVLMLEGINSVEDADRLADFGIAAFVVRSESLSDVFADVEEIGRLIGSAERAESHASLLRSATESITELTDSVVTRPRVLFLVGEDDLYAFGSGSYIHDVIQRAGGRSVTADIENRHPVLSEEYVLVEDPDFIVGAFGADHDPSILVNNHPAFAQLSAVQNGSVVSLDPDTILRPGPRLVNALTVLTASLHPGIFDESGSQVLVLE